jgi:hypothetical protein
MGFEQVEAAEIYTGAPPFEISVNAGGLIVGKPYLLQMTGYEKPRTRDPGKRGE